ncbi:hypothetical protein [Pseudalkalibacillus caeni]|uniref:hypothetical protein n=1 Tax=Exobacillus caeni TaxID=2574798 RepID=UPI001484FFF0|nr:hypothetical protein [Pseudalkalibacillus caeni]
MDKKKRDDERNTSPLTDMDEEKSPDDIDPNNPDTEETPEPFDEQEEKSPDDFQ